MGAICSRSFSYVPKGIKSNVEFENSLLKIILQMCLPLQCNARISKYFAERNKKIFYNNHGTLKTFGKDFLGKTTALWTTVAHPRRHFCKLGNGCILVINFFNKHSIVKMYLVKVVSLSGFHLKYLIKSLIFKIFFSAWFG